MQMNSVLQPAAAAAASQDTSKLCVTCGGPAEMTLCGLLSTLGVRPRKQKPAKSVPFCIPCLRALCRDPAVRLPPKLQDRLGAALTALTEARMKEVDTVRPLPVP